MTNTQKINDTYFTSAIFNILHKFKQNQIYLDNPVIMYPSYCSWKSGTKSNLKYTIRIII